MLKLRLMEILKYFSKVIKYLPKTIKKTIVNIYLEYAV